MVDHFKRIYNEDAERYERLIAREDQRGNLFAALMEIHPFDGATVVEFGAGTGRLTRIMSVLAKYLFSSDIAMPMLQVGKTVMEESGMENWLFTQADNLAMPIASNAADIAIEGWSFGHVTGWYPDNWRSVLDSILAEMTRVTKSGGTTILLETMGTGQREPSPPTETLAEMYAYLEQYHGYTYRFIRTDFQFESVEEADELMRFFFGDDMADTLVAGKKIIVPECTGIWYKTV